ncbi:MAG: trigger factor, partial [Parasporobacterium sp.]|nr:trigger factor [Parasporobacterium sp.]
VAVKPEVKLGEYKGLEYTAVDTKVAKAEVDAEIERVREMNSRRVPVEDRPAKDGDIVALDYEGFVDGVAFEGGKADNYSLTLGSHSFIDTFEEQIAGHNVGDEFEVNVTFPEEYHAENLKGKAAIFKCKLNDIKVKELPEADDEFASEVSEFETMKEYKADIKKNLEDAKKQEAKTAAEDELVAALIEKSEMIVPEPMIEAQAEQTARDFQMRVENSGMQMQQYLQMVGQTPEQFMEEIKPYALKTIQRRLVLEAVAKAENIEISDADVDAEIQKMADAYGIELDKLKEFMSDDEKKGIKDDLAVNKAAEVLFDNGKAVEKKEEKEEPKKKAAPKKTAKKEEKTEASEAPKKKAPKAKAEGEEAPKPAKKAPAKKAAKEESDK